MDEKEKDVCRSLRKALIDSEEAGSGGPSYKRLGGDERRHAGTVGDFLRKEEHQSGMWLIDCGQGYPPGHFTLIWSKAKEEWEFIGFYNHHLIIEARRCPQCDGKGGKDDGSGEICSACRGKGSTKETE